MKLQKRKYTSWTGLIMQHRRHLKDGPFSVSQNNKVFNIAHITY